MICQTYNAQTVQLADRTTSVSNDPYPQTEKCQSRAPNNQRHLDIPTPALTSFQIWHELVAATQLTRVENISVLSLSTAFQRLCIFASASAVFTGAAPASLKADFAALAPKWPNVPLVEGWLARLDAISLKGTNPGERALRNIEDLISVLTTSRKVVEAIKLHARSRWREPLNVYLVPWSHSLRSEREFRIFCPPIEDLTNSTMASISQYSPDSQLGHTDPLRPADVILHKSWGIFERIQSRVPSELLRQGFSFDVIFNDKTCDMALIELHEWVVGQEQSSHVSC